MLEKFHFTTATGEEIVVPFLDDAVKEKTARKIRKEHAGDFESLMDAFIAAALSPADRKKVDELSIRDYGKFVDGWTELDKKMPGESSV